MRCYWKKSLLSTIKNIKAKSVDELSGRNTDIVNPTDELLKAFIEMGKNQIRMPVSSDTAIVKIGTLYTWIT